MARGGNVGATRPPHGRPHGISYAGAPALDMNELDWFLLGGSIAAVVGGYQMGFFARTVSWVGLLAGLVAGVSALPLLLGQLSSIKPVDRFVIAAVVLIVLGFLGQGLGLAGGSALRRRLPRKARMGDRIAGGIAGLLGVVLVCWALLPAMANVPGWPARLARNSRVAHVLATNAPSPPDPLLAFRRYLGADRFPEVFSQVSETPEAGPPPGGLPFSAAETTRLAESSVQIEAVGCNQLHAGSGFLVADGIVTNAHVVAGATNVSVRTVDGRSLRARVLRYEPGRDLALLRVPGFVAPPLAMSDATPNEVAGVFGHPNGQRRLRVAPARVSEVITASGRDLYNSVEVQRSVLVLAADLAVGDSGSALVSADGRVVGVTFALAPDRPHTGYALDVTELRAMLAGHRQLDASTGACISG